MPKFAGLPSACRSVVLTLRVRFRRRRIRPCNGRLILPAFRLALLLKRRALRGSIRLRRIPHAEREAYYAYFRITPTRTPRICVCWVGPTMIVAISPLAGSRRMWPFSL